MNTSTIAKASTFALLLMLTGCGGGGSDNNNLGGSVTSATGLVDWTWMDGSKVVNDAGEFITAPLYPGSLEGAVSWADASGNLWLFGGGGCTLTGCGNLSNYKDFSDLWKFDVPSSTWILVNGHGFTNQGGAYGSLGIANANNQPGSRQYGATWVDGAGHLWLFGGRGLDKNSTFGNLNDLWEFDTQDWIWQGGSDTVNAVGIYGTTNDMPGARMDAISWTDSHGNFWMFGGYTNVGYKYFNDLWMYDFLNKKWIWKSGSQTANSPGVYGQRVLANPANVPGARTGAATWIDTNDVLWMFGGAGYDKNGALGKLNDLWKFEGSEWTWMGGSELVDQEGNYGIPGTPSANNIPAARRHPVKWADTNGNFWLFGGARRESSASGQDDDLNDLWKFNPVTKEWVWMSGSKALNQHGIYGTQGSADILNVPGARDIAVSWTNSNGFWLFGGQGFGSEDGSGSSSYGLLSDLWRFQPR